MKELWNHIILVVIRDGLVKISLFKFYLVLFFSFICPISPAQGGYLKIEKISKGEKFHFPVIHSKDKLVEEKINIHLQLGELELIRGKEKNNIFEVISRDKGTIYGGKIAIDFKILTNTEKILSIQFTQSSCGITCAYWVSYHNFNPQNGDRYVLKDFFDETNYRIFKGIVTPIRQERIKKQIEQLIKSGYEIEHIKGYLYSYITDDDLNDFYFTSDFIYFDNENLLNKHDKFLKLDHITTIPTDSIKHLLNDFGKAALITGKDLSLYRSLTDPQLYEGSFNNKLHFYLLFKNKYENNFAGIYTYKNIGRGIRLQGNFHNNIYEFSEINNRNEKLATINFIKEGETLKGTRKNKNGKTMKLKAYRK